MSRRAAPEAAKAESHERWIISYADMITLLFALFVVLYALSDTNPRKILLVQQSLERAFNVGVLSGSEGGSPLFQAGGGLKPDLGFVKGQDLASIRSQIQGLVQREAIDGDIQVRQDADSITISLADNLLFESGNAELRPGSAQVLLAVAGILNGLPNRLRIEGHTDNVPVNNPDYPSNWELSGARATTVLRFLEEQGGVTRTRLSLEGLADTRPLGDNTTVEGRALNRRADIVILYPTQEALDRALAVAGE